MAAPPIPLWKWLAGAVKPPSVGEWRMRGASLLRMGLLATAIYARKALCA
jgi:hypothetical protein